MLRFERRVTAALTGTTEPAQRAAVEDFVDGTLSEMPEVLRGGVALGSVGLSILAGILGPFAARRPADADAGDPIERDPVVARLAAVGIGPFQQYFRLFRSLVVFAEHETAPEPSV